MTGWLRFRCGAGLAIAGALAASGSATPAAAPRAAETVARPGTSLPATMVRRYTMSGAIRPLLFWIGRDDIGLARVVWRHGDAGARGYELLIGTDPARAPRSINRWGYIAEEVAGTGRDTGSMLALMTRAEESSSYEEASTSATRGRALGDFRAIRARVAGRTATWQVAAVSTPSPLTVHDLEAALDRVDEATESTRGRAMVVPRDVRTGFLAALAEQLDRAVQLTSRQTDAADPPDASVQYLFGGQVYELRLRRARRSVEQVMNESVAIVRSAFDIHTLSTGARTRFEIACGTAGDLAGVPVAVAWQPRWWLKVSLKLVD
jgi:hypothetical protein